MKATTKAALGAILLLALSCLHFQKNRQLSTFLARRLASTTVVLSPPPQISYTLWRNNTFQSLYSHRTYYRCRPDSRRNRHQLHPDMHEILNFTTKVSTNLKILFMGDSVAVQNVQSFQEAAGASHRSVFRYSWDKHVSIVRVRESSRHFFFSHDDLFVNVVVGGSVCV